MSDATIRRPGLLRRVVVLADESANWKIAGLRQLDRLALTLQEFASAKQPNEQIEVCVVWNSEFRAAVRNDSRLENLTIKNGDTAEIATDLVLSTRQLLYRGSVAQLLALPNGKSADGNHNLVCAYLGSPRDIAACERRFLEQNGKSQDGLVSRHVNRRGSRWLSRWLLKLPIAPTVWSAVIFILPILASFAFLRGTYLGFVIGAAIFQVYSIVDGCDGEIARAKFMQTEFGRRFDSLCDLVGNVLLAVTLGFGLARQANSLTNASWFYAAEGIAAAMLILTSEGIVFARRSRAENNPAPTGRWEGVLYQRHHEFLERSGILFFGEQFAWWLVQLTKRDMAMLAFFFLALLNCSACSLHLLLTVSAISSAFAGNAFLRQPAPAVAQEAS